MSTRNPDYAQRLIDREGRWWKRLLDVQAPYRWHLRLLRLGFVLDIGCGIGRNLAHLGGRGVGIDHNLKCVETARSRGFEVFTPDEFEKSPYSDDAQFDSLLVAHVAEHMTSVEAEALLKRYLPSLKGGGRVVLITPQEAGFQSDHTHVEFVEFSALERLGTSLGFRELKAYSFPLPRVAGRMFKYNEFVWIGQRP